MNKHAYLIIAHNNFYILEKLIKLLDDERNDIYIHIDKKVKEFDFEYFINICKKSNINFIKRNKVYWGSYSQIQCELNLLKEATKNCYKYYHLLSGVDLPIKSQNYIHDYFEKNKGIQFISFQEKEWDYDRVSKINLLTNYIKSNNRFARIIHILLKKITYKLMNMINFDYTKKFSYEFKKGDNWFSITHEAATYICSNEKLIKDMFKYSYCGDEHFVHTILYNSKFKEKISYDTCLREIDWHRGFPYIYTSEDYHLLMKSQNLFARKFDYEKDKDIVYKIYDTLTS